MWFQFLYFQWEEMLRSTKVVVHCSEEKGAPVFGTELLWEKELLQRDCPSTIELYFQECGSNRSISSCHGITNTQNNPFFIVIIVFTLTKCFKDKHSQVRHGVSNFHETREKFSHSLESSMPGQDSMLRSLICAP